MAKAIRKGWIEDGIGYIPLTQGQVALVDADMVGSVDKWNWHASWSKCTRSFYAMRNEKSNGVFRTLGMHAFIAGGIRRVDHRDGNTLDNRRHNLRIATSTQQSQNRRGFRNSVSGVKGVTFDPKCNCWRSRICVDHTPISLGYFKNLEEAKDAYSTAAEKYFGEFARK